MPGLIGGRFVVGIDRDAGFLAVLRLFRDIRFGGIIGVRVDFAVPLAAGAAQRIVVRRIWFARCGSGDVRFLRARFGR
ncbi:Uncharacterised protein [Mycobacteroides abscessus subsp. abscessus]|nr:Uncharacterised protein [Mycobacteroides abscessus subsp. abscessus]